MILELDTYPDCSTSWLVSALTQTLPVSSSSSPNSSTELFMFILRPTRPLATHLQTPAL
jgi:hypothetical protein